MAKDASRPLASDMVGRNAGGPEAFPHGSLDPPRDGADKPLRRRRGEGGANTEDLGHERRIAADPVAHDDPSAGLGHPHGLACDVEWPWRKHRAEHADHSIELPVGHAIEVGCVPFLKSDVGQLCRFRPGAGRGDQVAGDIDPEHMRPELRGGQRGRAVAAAEVEHGRAGRDAE